MSNGTDPARGPRYPARATCPDCGCDVAASADGTKLRAHATVAMQAGRPDSPCAIGSNKAQELVAQQHRREAGSRRKAYWAAKDAEAVSTLPKHLR